MTGPRSTVAALTGELARAFDPLVEAFSSDAALRDFLEDLGWDLGAATSQLDVLKSPVEQALTVGDSGEADGTSLPAVTAAYRAISDLRNAGGLPNDFRAAFPGQLAEFLVVEHLVNQRPVIGHLLRTLGVIRFEEVPAAGGRPAHTRRTIAFSDFGDLLDEPFVFFRSAYAWGQSTFDGERLLENLADLSAALEFPTYQLPLSEPAANALTTGALDPAATADHALRVPLVESNIDPAALSAGIGLFLLPETGGIRPGLALLPYASGEFTEAVVITDSLDLTIHSGLDLAGGVGVLLRPDREVDTVLGLESGGPSGASGTVALELRLARPGTPLVVLGVAGGTRLEAAGASATAGTRFHSNGRFEALVEVALERARIVIKPAAGESDGFLAMLLPPDGLQAEFDLDLGLSTARGVYFDGSAGLEVNIPVHVQLGPVEFQSALLAVGVRPPAGEQPFGIPVEMAATIRADLGLIKAVIENVGMTTTFTFPDGASGNLGPIDLALAFRPPNGVGLAIDAGVVKGGGYLFFDQARGEYAGALELEFAESLTLKAIGLISTRMPGGAPGFSLLVIVVAEFPGGLQLGYGFKLLAVGGLIGLGRTMRQQALIDGVRSGALESVMFPRDVIANAPRILSDLGAYFPPQAGHFLIAPMAKLAWGTPTLLTVSVGVIVEIPGNVALIGVLKVVLPTEQAPVLRLQVNFAGVIDFDGQRAHLFAALFDSRVLTTPIDGEMGVLARWGDDPNLVLTVGGFHPAFTPPPLPFPTPRRVSLDILNRSNARLQVSGYFAVTSNTAQFGAHADLFFKFSAFQVEGDVGFDALFRFSPFAFQIDVSASVSLKAFGVGCFSISLRFALEGPTPWRAHGRGSVSLFFFDISADFDLTWGEERDTTLPPIDMLSLVAAEVSKHEGWETRSPARKTLVSLRRLPATEDQLVLHPTGTLFVRQRAVPLDLTLDRIGSQRPRDVNRVSVDVAGGGLVKRGDTGELFAPAQFIDMDDAAKLSRPAFERQHGGLELSPDGTALASARAVCRSARYEQVVFDEGLRRRPRPFVPYPTTLFNHLMAGNSVSRSPLSHARRTQAQPFADTIGLAGDSFTVAHTRDNTAAAPAFASDAAARDLLARRLAEEPELAGSLHVIPTAEVRG